jgi:flagellar hook assembly protein FlgD
LYQASPSLIRDYARISYYVGRRADVELGVYDATGSLVRTLASGSATPGLRTAVWNRADNRGRRVASGTYFYRLVVDGDAVSGKAVILK